MAYQPYSLQSGYPLAFKSLRAPRRLASQLQLPHRLLVALVQRRSDAIGSVHLTDGLPLGADHLPGELVGQLGAPREALKSC